MTGALASVLASNPRGVLAGYDELSGWARSMNQYKSKGADRQFWLAAWSSSPVAVDRKGRSEPIYIPMPFITVVGGIQPAVLPELADRREDGLLDRFLFSYPEPHRSRLTDHEISDEATSEYTDLYDRLAGLTMREGDHGEPLPSVVSLSLRRLGGLQGVVGRVAGRNARARFSRPSHRRLEQAGSLSRPPIPDFGSLPGGRVTEARSRSRMRTFSRPRVLLGYFKAHAQRVHVGLHGHNAHDLLAKDLAEFLREHGGEWKDEPNVLHEELRNRKSEALPERPDELCKMVYAISNQGTWLKAEPGWKKNEEGKSRRAIHLCFRNGVDGVVGVDHEAD